MQAGNGIAAVALLVALACLGSAAPALGKSKITFYLGLERPEGKASSAFFNVGDPASSTYRRFHDVGEVSERFGASENTRRTMRRAARRRGLDVGFDASGVFARVRGTRARLERAFSVRIKKQLSDEPISWVFSVRGNDKPRLPRAMRPHVREFVGTYIRAAPKNATQRAVSRTDRAGAPSPPPRIDERQGPAPANEGTWTDGCAEAQATGSYSFDQVRDAYGIDALGGGEGASVAILNSAEGVTAGDIADNAACFGLPEIETRTLLTDGQKKPFGHDEPAEPQLDLALVRGMSPALERLTFTQVWGTPDLYFLGPAQVLAERELPDALTISYGFCERQIRGYQADYESRASAKLQESLYVRLGLAGVGTFVASGDSGSTCDGTPIRGVAWPSSSPYVTAVGGTRLELNDENERVDEVVWNDLAWLPENDGGGAGGGGTSSVSPRPPYQAAIDAPTARRAVPDLSAHASLLPGWPVVFAGDWLEVGGTSASAPLTASAFAAISARERAAGRPPLGPVNGLVYALQRTNPELFFDVVSGNNAFDPKVRGIPARPGYDRASGLGVPRFDALAASVPLPAG